MPFISLLISQENVVDGTHYFLGASAFGAEVPVSLLPLSGFAVDLAHDGLVELPEWDLRE
jgi:hypothetical protein